MRLDFYLIENQMARSRSHAQDLIKRGLVKVNYEVIKKPKYEIADIDVVQMEKREDFVSRSANKLESFLKALKLKLSGKVCFDIGSSTGGFTQVLLQNEVQKVYAIDVGKDQLVQSLKEDSRVVSLEGVDAKKDLPIDQKFDLASIDVSFTSAKPILLNLLRYANSGAKIILLFKPQFEGDKETVGPKKIVSHKNSQIIKSAFQKWLLEHNFKIENYADSVLKGKKGNQESLYLLTFKES